MPKFAELDNAEVIILPGGGGGGGNKLAVVAKVVGIADAGIALPIALGERLEILIDALEFQIS